jgi:hypothetical protein
MSDGIGKRQATLLALLRSAADENVLECLPGLSEEEWGYLAYTLRRYWR